MRKDDDDREEEEKGFKIVLVERSSGKKFTHPVDRRTEWEEGRVSEMGNPQLPLAMCENGLHFSPHPLGPFRFFENHILMHSEIWLQTQNVIALYRVSVPRESSLGAPFEEEVLREDIWHPVMEKRVSKRLRLDSPVTTREILSPQDCQVLRGRGFEYCIWGVVVHEGWLDSIPFEEKDLDWIMPALMIRVGDVIHFRWYVRGVALFSTALCWWSERLDRADPADLLTRMFKCVDLEGHQILLMHDTLFRRLQNFRQQLIFANADDDDDHLISEWWDRSCLLAMVHLETQFPCHSTDSWVSRLFDTWCSFSRDSQVSTNLMLADLWQRWKIILFHLGPHLVVPAFQSLMRLVIILRKKDKKSVDDHTSHLQFALNLRKRGLDRDHFQLILKDHLRHCKNPLPSLDELEQLDLPDFKAVLQLPDQWKFGPLWKKLNPRDPRESRLLRKMRQ